MQQKLQLQRLLELGYKLVKVPSNQHDPLENEPDLSLSDLDTVMGKLNVAVRLGEREGNTPIFCVSFDKRYGGIEVLNGLYGDFPPTACCINESGGKDFYFTGIEESSEFPKYGVKIFGTGSSRLIPYSYIDGEKFEWVHALYETNILESPSWLLKTLRKNNVSQLKIVNPVPEKKETTLEMPLPTGLLLDLYELCLETSYNKIPEFAMAAAQTILSAVSQRTVMPPRAGCLSAYSLLLGPASSGKGHYLQFVQTVLRLVDPRLLTDDVKTSESLKMLLGEYPSRCAVNDECVGPLSNVYSRQGTSMDRGKHDLELKLWSILPFLAGTKTKKKEGCVAPITNPRFSQIGAGVLGDFLELLQLPKVLTDGYLARMNIYTTDVARLPEFQKGRRFKLAVPDGIVQRLKDVQGKMEMSHVYADSVPTLMEEPMDIDEASVALWNAHNAETQEKIDITILPGMTQFYGRVGEKVERLASVAALSDGACCIDVRHMAFAIKLQNYLSQKYEKMISEVPASALDALTTSIADLVLKQGSASTTDLKRKCPLFKAASFQMQNEAIQSLKNDAIITISTSQNGGKRLIYLSR